MKKILALLLALCLILCLVACGNEDTTSDTISDVSQTQSTTDTSSEKETTSTETSSTESGTENNTSTPTNNETASTTSTESSKPSSTSKPTDTSKPTTSTTTKPTETHTHTWGNWSVETKALIGKDGTEKRTCSGCNEVEKRTTKEMAADNSFMWGAHWYIMNGLPGNSPDSLRNMPYNEELIQAGTLLNYIVGGYEGAQGEDSIYLPDGVVGEYEDSSYEIFTMSFSNVIKFLSAQFYVDDKLKAELKSNYRYDSTTDTFKLKYHPPLNWCDVEGYTHVSGNRYTVYYSAEGSYLWTTEEYYFKVDLEYNLLNNKPNKYLSVMRIESLPKNITK